MRIITHVIDGVMDDPVPFCIDDFYVFKDMYRSVGMVSFDCAILCGSLFYDVILDTMHKSNYMKTENLYRVEYAKSTGIAEPDRHVPVKQENCFTVSALGIKWHIYKKSSISDWRYIMIEGEVEHTEL